MGDDKEILREIWDGRIPVCFQLSEQELDTIQQLEPFYLMVPRLSYFPLVTDKVKRHFSRFVNKDSQDGEMWLEYNGQPLKWHYPIGVLFDLYAFEGTLPWTLTVHFQNFPEGEILHCPSKEAVESHFIMMIKEADVLKHRGARVNVMLRRDLNHLFLGLQNDKFDQYWTANRKLMSDNDERFHFIPFRLVHQEGPFVQKQFRPLGAGNEVLSLENLIQDVFPQALGENRDYRILIQGIEPPLSTPLVWLSKHFSHADNFLYLCVNPC